jgi:hypothetical protein
MEQRLDATYLRPALTERAAALGIGAVGIGTGIFLAAWGISFLWNYTPPEIRLANPQVTVTQPTPFKIEQDKPFKVEQDKPFKVGQDRSFKVEQDKPFIAPPELPNSDRKEANAIKREVTVFSNVKHGAGTVVTGWSYRDGSGGVPIRQYCYYTTPNVDHSSKRVDIASNRVRSSNIDAGVVPDLEGALAKCQWWQA